MKSLDYKTLYMYLRYLNGKFSKNVVNTDSSTFLGGQLRAFHIPAVKYMKLNASAKTVLLSRF